MLAPSVDTCIRFESAGKAKENLTRILVRVTVKRKRLLFDTTFLSFLVPFTDEERVQLKELPNKECIHATVSMFV